MKTIATVNTVLPTLGNAIDFHSGDSLRDYDIVLLHPRFPYEERIEFGGGGSCLSIEASTRIQSGIRHWRAELTQALKTGKTVFVILAEQKSDSGASGSSFDKNRRTYHTFPLSNYDMLPEKIGVRNTKGRQILVADSAYRGLHDVLKEVAQYRAIIEPPIGQTIYTAKDGSPVGAIVGVGEFPGKMVLLPYFNLLEYDDEDQETWSKKAMQLSNRIVSQLVSIDAHIQNTNSRTPAPEWVTRSQKPKKITSIEKRIHKIEAEISALGREREHELESRDSLLEFSHLLYESGKALERAIKKSLELLGYHVEQFRAGDLEIDHIITSPEGFRMIGESEGKDASAVDISKFRQLESNINEDFQRDEVDTPSKGVLFGNGFRFTLPSERPEQFTAKCLTNAKRLGTALVRTADLYQVTVHILDNPKDEKFKSTCREAIQETVGDIVAFPASSDRTSRKRTT